MERLLDVSQGDRKLAMRVMLAVRSYARGEAGDVTKLHGRVGEWRLRVGNLRVIFSVDSSAGTIEVLNVLDRRDAYD